MILEKQVADLKTVEGVETQPERFDLYQEVQATTIDDKVVTIKQLVGSFTESEIRADISNLENSIADLQNQRRDKENILEEFNK